MCFRGSKNSLGGIFDKYTVIIQGDQAGPHEEDGFVRFMRSYCSEMGWCFEPQSPQSPHLNNLDLAVFPALSKRYSARARQNGLRLLRPQEIWETSLQAWAELPSCKIARALVLAYRLAKKVVEEGGDNNFLRGKGSKGLHSGISKDFYDTNTGIERKDGQKFEVVEANPEKHAHRAHIRAESEAWKESYPFPKQNVVV